MFITHFNKSANNVNKQTLSMSIKDWPARVDEIKTKIKSANGGKEHLKTNPHEYNKYNLNFGRKKREDNTFK